MIKYHILLSLSLGKEPALHNSSKQQQNDVIWILGKPHSRVQVLLPIMRASSFSIDDHCLIEGTRSMLAMQD